MYGISKRSRGWGIEITSSGVRTALFAGTGRNSSVFSTRKVDLAPGIVSESYSDLNISDPHSLIQEVANCLDGRPGAGRAGLSLPDSIFRVQTLEFEELPGKSADRERLIRWRLEKAAAFDLSDALLRHQVLRRGNSGFTVLVCAAKRAVIEQYESVIVDLGLEPWSIALSSFSTFNFYAPYMMKRSGACALTHVTDGSFATIVSENGGARFYRFKEIKRANADEIRSRLVREIADSLHFYTHMDRSQQVDVGHLYLTGEQTVCTGLAGELGAETSLEVEVLAPHLVLSNPADTAPELAAALGAGRTVI